MVSDTSTPRPRVRRSIRRLVLWVGPVLSLIVAWQIWDAVEARRLALEVARVFPRGTVPATARPEIEDDAAPYYAAALVAANGRGPTFDQRQRDAMLAATELPQEVEVTVSRVLARNELALRLMEEGSRRPYERLPPGVEPRYRIGSGMGLSRAAGARTLDLLRRGDADASAASLFARVRYLRALDPPTMLSAMVKTADLSAIATDTALLLSRSRVADGRLAELEEALRDVYASDELASAADELGRTILVEMRSRYRTLRSLGNGVVILTRPALQHQTVGLLQTTADAVAAARLPWPERLRAVNRLQDRRSPILERLQPLFRSGAFGIAEELKRLTTTTGSGLAAARCARMAAAIERYRVAGGAFPERLEDVPLRGDATDAYIDPFTGQPLRYVRDDEGYTLYSLGSNVSDDGGKLIGDVAPGRTTPTLPPPDIGVRVRDYRLAAATNASNSARNSPVR